MCFTISSQPERWADLLTVYAENNQKRIKIHHFELEDNHLLAISHEVVENIHSFSQNTLLKLKQAFEKYLGKLHHDGQPRTVLDRFSVRFARFAQNHSTLAKILVFISFGLFKHIWEKGIRLQMFQNHMTAFKSHIEILEKQLQTLLKEVPPEKGEMLPTDLLGIVFEYLDTSDRIKLMRWDVTKKALEQVDRHRDEIIDRWKKKIIQMLQPEKEFEKEIKELDHLKDGLNQEEFQDPAIPLHYKDYLVEREVFKFFFNITGNNPLLKTKFSPLLDSSKEFHLFCLKHNQTFQFEDSLWEDREFILAALRTDGNLYQFFPEKFKKDEEFIHTAVKNLRRINAHTEKIFKGSPFAFEAIKHLSDLPIYFHLQKEFSEDQYKQIILEASLNPNIRLCDMNEKVLIEDMDLMMGCLQRNGMMIELASEELKNTKEVAYAAVRSDGLALHLLPFYFRNDRDCVAIALEQNGMSFPYVSKTLKKDRQLALIAVKSYGEAIENMTGQPNLMSDKEIVLTALKNQSGDDPDDILKWFKCIHNDLKADSEIAYEAIHICGLVLEALPPKFKANKDLALLALKNCLKAYDYIAEELKQDPDILKARGEQVEEVPTLT